VSTLPQLVVSWLVPALYVVKLNLIIQSSTSSSTGEEEREGWGRRGRGGVKGGEEGVG
jgi:hypothetical protein